MSNHFLRRLKIISLCGFCAVMLLQVAPAFAQTKDSAKTEAKSVDQQAAIPLAVLCAAGVERWMSNVDYLFAAVKREELSDFVGGQMSKLNDLKGLDKDKPFGVLIFLRPGLIPQPYPVAFAPVKNLSDLIGTASGGPFTVKKIDDTHFELVTDTNTIHVRLAGDYAWLAQEIEQLDYQFPDPAEYTKRLATRYDVAFEFNLTSVPEGMKNIFLDFLRASTETSMQQRDGEPDAGYQLRRVNALNTLDFVEQLILQGERLTFGLAVDPKTRHASIEADVVATTDSTFARSLQDLATRPSYFANVLRDDVPLTFSMSWMMPVSNQKRLVEFFETAEQEAVVQLANAVGGEKPKVAAATPPIEAPKATSTGKVKRGGTGKLKKPKLPVPPAIKDVFDSLRTAANVGHIDFFVQFLADNSNSESPRFTLIGGAKVADGTRLASGVTEILRQVKDRPQLAALDFNVDSHAGVTFHQLRGSEIRRSDEMMYGGKPSLYLGLGSQAVWFAIGQPSAMAQLKQVIDRVQAGPAERPTGNDRIPFQFTMHMKRWIEFGQHNGEELRREGERARDQAIAAQQAEAEARGDKPADTKSNTPPSPGPREGGRNELNQYGDRRPQQEFRRQWEEIQRKAFSGDDDLLRVNFKPTDQGARLRLEFDESFIRLAGFGVSSGIDASVKASKEREERQKKESEEKKRD